VTAEVGDTLAWLAMTSEASAFNQLTVVTVNDRSGNRQIAGVQVRRDVTPPTVLTFTAPVQTRSEPAVVQWNAVDDGAGVRNYDLSVLIDGITRTQVLTQSTATSYAAGVLPSTHFYEWQLVAWDHVNNAVTRTATTAGVQATKTYYFGASRVAVREAGVLSYLHSDQLSSVSASTDASGKVVGRQLFEPFGAVRATFGEVDGSWGWATHRKTEDTGLTFMRARWYAPGVGRFVSPDSVVPDAAEPQIWNRYSYVLNNPLKYSDPSGHCPKPPPGYANVICVAGFIPTKVSEAPFKNFSGDDRDFSSNSNPEGKTGSSRFWVWIDADTGSIIPYTDSKGYTHKNGVVHDTYDADTGEVYSQDESWNTIQTTKNKDGSITLYYHVLCAHRSPLCEMGPDGTITFHPNASGSYDTSVDIDAFPNVEAYHWQKGGLVNPFLFRIQAFSKEDRDRGSANGWTSLNMSPPFKWLLGGVKWSQKPPGETYGFDSHRALVQK